MIRLTTPTHRFKFPFPLDGDVAKVRITYTQNRIKVLEKDFTEFDGTDTIEYTLTQAETKAFRANAKTEVQIRLLTAGGNALASCIYSMNVQDVLNEEVMTDAD